MKTNILSRKRMIPVAAAAAIITFGGTAWAAETRDDVRNADRSRIAEAAVKAAGGGTATDIEHSDDAGAAYEVEVQRKDGVEVDVNLDKNLRVVPEADDNDDADDRGRDNDDDANERDDVDDADDRNDTDDADDINDRDDDDDVRSPAAGKGQPADDQDD